MRFESLLWSLLALFLVAGAGWEEQTLVGGATAGPEFQAADSGSDVPPPRP